MGKCVGSTRGLIYVYGRYRCDLWRHTFDRRKLVQKKFSLSCFQTHALQHPSNIKPNCILWVEMLYYVNLIIALLTVANLHELLGRGVLYYNIIQDSTFIISRHKDYTIKDCQTLERLISAMNTCRQYTTYIILKIGWLHTQSTFQLTYHSGKTLVQLFCFVCICLSFF